MLSSFIATTFLIQPYPRLHLPQPPLLTFIHTYLSCSTKHSFIVVGASYCCFSHMSSDPETDGIEPPSKRRKLSAENATSIIPPNTNPPNAKRTSTPRSLERPITPPPSRRTQSSTPKAEVSQLRRDVGHASSHAPLPLKLVAETQEQCQQACRYIPSAIQLTRIRDLPSVQNIDTIGLGDILGDPLIKECWNFNFLFDLDFVM